MSAAGGSRLGTARVTCRSGASGSHRVEREVVGLRMCERKRVCRLCIPCGPLGRDHGAARVAGLRRGVVCTLLLPGKPAPAGCSRASPLVGG